jgi:hypothetical protein
MRLQAESLASKILALAARERPHDGLQRYAYCPVLLETFVGIPRHRRTSGATLLACPFAVATRNAPTPPPGVSYQRSCDETLQMAAGASDHVDSSTGLALGVFLTVVRFLLVGSPDAIAPGRRRPLTLSRLGPAAGEEVSPARRGACWSRKPRQMSAEVA